jgi:hypothetical protein
METAGIRAGLKQWHPAIFGLGVFAERKPRGLETASIHAGHPCGFSPFGVYAPRKLQGMEPAGIHAGLKQWHPVIFGHGVFAQQKPRGLETADILSAVRWSFT